MAKKIKPEDLDDTILQELTLFHKKVVDRVNLAGEEAAKALVKKTKATAPKKSGAFRKAITYVTETDKVTGTKRFVWGVKAPHHRLTHLLVHGHAKENGGRVDGDPFLENALDDVLPEYEKAVEEAITE